MKWLLGFSLIIYFFEELESVEEVKEIYTDSADECQNDSLTEITCNLTALPLQYVVHITEKDKYSNMNLRIIGAKEVKLMDSPKSYYEIILSKCKDVEARTTKFSNYKIFLYDTNASVVNETVKYFKSVNSRITTLLLRNTTEFDISESKIKTMEAESDSLTPKIIHSNITSLELKLTGNTELNIRNTTIDVVKKLKYDSSSESLCSYSTLQSIKKESIVISNGRMKFLDTFLEAESESFHIKKGELIFDNLDSRLSSDSIILSPNGTFVIRSRDSDRVFTINFKIEEVFNTNESDNNFFPLTKIMLKDNTLTIVLSVFGLVMLFIILVIVIYILYKKFMLSKKDPYTNNLSSFISNKDETKETSKYIGREYLSDIKSDEENDYGRRKTQDKNNYSDSQISPGKKKFSKANQEVDFINQEVNTFEDVQEEYIDNEIPDEELVQYTEPESPIAIEELYSDNMYPSEQIQKPQPNQIITVKSDKSPFNSDNIYPTSKVNELKEKLNKSGFKNSDLHNPYQKPKSINLNSEIGSNPLKLFPKPGKFDFAQNSPNGTQNLPNVSFLSRNKDQIRKVEPPKNLPQLNPSLPPNFLLNKTLPQSSLTSLSNHTIQPILTEQDGDEENFYEEYSQN